jgi:hypothetical protein
MASYPAMQKAAGNNPLKEGSSVRVEGCEKRGQSSLLQSRRRPAFARRLFPAVIRRRPANMAVAELALGQKRTLSVWFWNVKRVWSAWCGQKAGPFRAPSLNILQALSVLLAAGNKSILIAGKLIAVGLGHWSPSVATTATQKQCEADHRNSWQHRHIPRMGA